MVTKSQVMVLLPVCLFILMLLDHSYYKLVGWQTFIVPFAVAMGCVLVWYVAQCAIVGPQQFQHNAAVLREGFALHIVSINPTHWRNAAGEIWRTGFWLWGFPSLTWGLYQARRRNSSGLSHAMTLMLPFVGLLWFTIFSVGWGRYAFYAFALTPIWTAELLLCLGHSTCILHKRRLGLRGLSVALIGFHIMYNGWLLARNLAMPADTGYLAMCEYLATQIPSDAVIESWEWEISLDAIQPIHHPPTSITNVFTEEIWSNRQLPSGLYDVWQAQPDYILQGPFSAWTGIYRDILATQGAPITKFGSYALYRLRPTPLPNQPQ